MYIHCWGGHGRTGTVVSIMLGLLYGLPPLDAMRWVQFCHDLRVAPMGVPSPQTEPQRLQVIRVLNNLRAKAGVVPRTSFASPQATGGRASMAQGLPPPAIAFGEPLAAPPRTAAAAALLAKAPVASRSGGRPASPARRPSARLSASPVSPPPPAASGQTGRPMRPRTAGRSASPVQAGRSVSPTSASPPTGPRSPPAVASSPAPSAGLHTRSYTDLPTGSTAPSPPAASSEAPGDGLGLAPMPHLSPRPGGDGADANAPRSLAPPPPGDPARTSGAGVRLGPRSTAIAPLVSSTATVLGLGQPRSAVGPRTAAALSAAMSRVAQVQAAPGGVRGSRPGSPSGHPAGPAAASPRSRGTGSAALERIGSSPRVQPGRPSTAVAGAPRSPGAYPQRSALPSSPYAALMTRGGAASPQLRRVLVGVPQASVPLRTTPPRAAIRILASHPRGAALLPRREAPGTRPATAPSRQSL
jgi:hypothetical protein